MGNSNEEAQWHFRQIMKSESSIKKNRDFIEKERNVTINITCRKDTEDHDSIVLGRTCSISHVRKYLQGLGSGLCSVAKDVCRL